MWSPSWILYFVSSSSSSLLEVAELKTVSPFLQMHPFYPSWPSFILPLSVSIFCCSVAFTPCLLGRHIPSPSSLVLALWCNQLENLFHLLSAIWIKDRVNEESLCWSITRRKNNFWTQGTISHRHECALISLREWLATECKLTPLTSASSELGQHNTKLPEDTAFVLSLCQYLRHWVCTFLVHWGKMHLGASF